MKMEKENYFDIANHKFCCINGGYETIAYNLSYIIKSFDAYHKTNVPMIIYNKLTIS